MRLALFLLVAGLHGCFLFFFVFTRKPTVSSLAPAVQVMQLVSIQEASPPPAPLPLPAPPEKPLALIPPHTVETLETIAETMIETEELSAETVPLNLHLSPAVQSNTPGSTGANRDDGAAANHAALIAGYVQKNFNYIQRRIRDKLVYPPRAKRTGVQGSAEILFTIHLDGRVSGVSVAVSSGHDILDKAAIEALYAAAPFRPPPVQARIAVPITFRLR
jgi:protein TonB